MSIFARMFGKRPPSAAGDERRITDVGWVLEPRDANMIWDAPQPLRHDHPKPGSSKSAALCPAVIEFDRRHYVINSPIDAHFRMAKDAGGRLQLMNMAGPMGAVRQGALNGMVVVMPQHEWRHPQRPVLQITTPYLFVADDPVYVNQFPPFLHHRDTRFPGVQLCGRFPIDVWPRLMMWAFEWHDLNGDLVLRRGEPWFYVRFETTNPGAQVRLVEADWTKDLENYVREITDVSNYVNQSFSLFKKARERRPERLLVPKKRSTAEA